MIKKLKIWLLRAEIAYWNSDDVFRDPLSRRIVARKQRARRAKLKELEG